ncbi:MAG TPA: retropepsin-like aspartic protease [bacterium]|nr:retropepsin-like aspartic protease [bacterium]
MTGKTLQRNALSLPLALALAAAWLPGCEGAGDAGALWEVHQRLVLGRGELPRAGSLIFTTDVLGYLTESELEYRLGEDGSLEGFRIIPLSGPDQGLVVWSPDGGLEKTTGGAVRRLSPRENEEAAINALFLSGAYLELEPSFGPEGEVILNWDGALLRLTLEPDGRLSGAEVFFDERIWYAGFGEPGDGAPHLSRTVSVNPGDSPAYELERAEFRELDPGEVDLTPPEPSGLVYDESAERTIPLRLAGGMLLASATVGGLELELAVDSGAAISYLRPDVAEKLGLVPVGESLVVSLGNDATGHGVAVVDGLVIGPVTLEGQTVVIGEPSFLLSLVAPFDGLIGYDLLGQVPARLDVEAGTLELLPPGAEPVVPPGAVVVPIHLPGRLPQVPGELEGVGGLSFILDSGSPLELLVLPRSAGRLMDLSGAQPGDYTFMSLTGLGGIMGALLRQADYYLVGAQPATGVHPSFWRVDDPRVTYTLGEAGGPLSVMDADALLGLPFLVRFAAVIFDYPRERLILEPRAEGPAE